MLLRLVEMPVPAALESGAVLCRISLSTICGSDLHTTSGRRVEPAPSILGHESVGIVVAIGDDARHWSGNPVRVGERISWSIMASCGRCTPCSRGLRQKCVHLRKYGHLPTSAWPGLNGGYAEYIYLYPGTATFPLPDELEDTLAAPANCALATVVCAMEAIGGVATGDRVLILGAGLLGTYLAALCADAGAAAILVTDRSAARAESARRFGATAILSGDGGPEAVGEWTRALTNGEGVDAAFEVCGDPSAARAAIEAVRVDGRVAIAGLVTPKSHFEVDGNQLTRKLLTLRGVHNYHPDHLGKALGFLVRTATKFPYADLVSPVLPLEAINRALELARDNAAPRVGIRP